MNLAERLKQAREFLAYTQKDIAKAVFVSVQMWRAYESGKSVPGGNVLEAMARLGFSVDWLLTGEGEKRRVSAIRDLEDTYFQIPFRDELQISVTRALIELASPDIDKEKAHKIAAFSLEAMETLGQGREAVPPINYIRRIVRLIATLYDFYESDNDDSEVSALVTNRVTRLMEKIATKGKEKGYTNEEERDIIRKMVDEMEDEEGQ